MAAEGGELLFCRHLVNGRVLMPLCVGMCPGAGGQHLLDLGVISNERKNKKPNVERNMEWKELG